MMAGVQNMPRFKSAYMMPMKSQLVTPMKNRLLKARVYKFDYLDGHKAALSDNTNRRKYSRKDL